MATAVWMVFAVTSMVGIFAGCVVAVVIGIRGLEALRERRRRKADA